MDEYEVSQEIPQDPPPARVRLVGEEAESWIFEVLTYQDGSSGQGRRLPFTPEQAREYIRGWER